MKKLRNRPHTNTVINEAASTEGTVFYRISNKLVKQTLDNADNLIFRYLVRKNGIDAFNLDKLYGSAVFDDDLYLCKTDGQDISVNGEEVYPEDALELYSPEELKSYIKDGDEAIVKRELTSYELAGFDLDEVAVELIEGGHSFVEVVEAAYDMDLLSSVI